VEDVDFDGSENWLNFERAVFVAFGLLEQQFIFIRSMLERSPNLHSIILKGDEQCLL
jgi:hypothetical protein